MCNKKHRGTVDPRKMNKPSSRVGPQYIVLPGCVVCTTDEHERNVALVLLTQRALEQLDLVCEPETMQYMRDHGICSHTAALERQCSTRQIYNLWLFERDAQR